MKYGPSGGAVDAFTLDSSVSISNPGGLAVNPSNGHLFVSPHLANHNIFDFTSSGTYTGKNKYSGPGSATGIAVDTAGDLYAAIGSSTVKFTADCAQPCTTHTLFDNGYSNGVAVDPATDDVFIADNTNLVHYNSSGRQLAAVRHGKCSSAYACCV